MNEVNTPQTWAELLEWREDLPPIIHKWLKVIGRLFLFTKLIENDELGELIVDFLFASHRDINDLMTLSHTNSHHGSQYFLRTLFERTVTLKYLSHNPELVKDFKEYDAVDTDSILKGIHALTGMTVGEPAHTNITKRAGDARKKNKQEKCPVCKNQRPMSWTTMDIKTMAGKVGLDRLYLNCYTIPSKLMHPTLWGARERMDREVALHNTLQSVHQLMVETILIHRRHFVKTQRVTPIMRCAVIDYLSFWVYSDTTFDGVLTKGADLGGEPIYYGF
jgi:hypothetical protein